MGFSVEPQTAAAALAKCGALTEVAIERSRAECCKMLCGRHVARVLRNYRALFEPLLPCLSHVSDAAWENAVSAIQAAPDDLTVRMGLLFCAVEPEQAAILARTQNSGNCGAACAVRRRAAAGAASVIRRHAHAGSGSAAGLTLLQAARAVAHGDGVRQDDLRDLPRRRPDAGYGRVLRPIDAGRERRRRAGGGHSRGRGCGAALEELLKRSSRDAAKQPRRAVGAACIHGRHGRGQL
ncbi:MAG: hypothetical protein ACLRZH_19440 [Ruthenibacterium lactatiformans]